MENIQKHIEHDKKVIGDPMVSSQARRHAQEELEALERYRINHPEDDHDPTPLELFCDENPYAPECKIYDN